jgi:hypothetical protein
MGSMKIEVPHELKAADARSRMKELGLYWEKKYGIKPSWTKDSAKVKGSIMGFSFDAVLDVAKAAVTLSGPEPNFLVRKKVIGYLEHKLKEYLDPDTSLKDLESKREEVE